MADVAERLLETMPDGILVVSTDGTIRYANSVAARLSAYPASELVGRQVDDLVPEAHRASHRDDRERFAKAHQARSMGSGLDIHLRRADGSLLPVDVALSWMDDEVIVAFRDATSSREAETQIRRSRERLAAINDVHAAILRARPLDEVLGIVAERARWIAVADVAVVLLGDAQDVQVRAATGADKIIGRRISDGIVGDVISSGEVAVIDDISTDPRCVLARELDLQIGPAVVVPLGAEGAVGGALVIGRTSGGFSVDDVSVVVTFAAQAAVAVERARLLTDRRRLAVMEERDRIARDLHDGVIQSLFAVGLGLSAQSPDQAMLDRSIDAIDAVIRDLRNYIFGLGDEAADRSLEGLLEDLAREMQPPSPGPTIHTQIDLRVAAAVGGRAGTLLFAAREALSNAIRHAGARTVRLRVRREGAEGILEVADDGNGFDPDAAIGRGDGLKNLRTRAEAFGGSLELDSGDEGSVVTLRFPI